MERSTLLNKNILEPIFSFLYKAFRYLLLIGVSYMAVFPIIKLLFDHCRGLLCWCC